MIEYFFEIIEVDGEKQIKGEKLLLQAFKRLKIGRYRNELYSTNKRSLNQNSYIHVVFTLAQKGLYNGGYGHVRTMEDAKWFYKELYLKYDAINEQTGEKYPVVRHTSELSKDEMAVFIDQVINNQLEFFGVRIPDSEEWKRDHARYDLVQLSQ